MFSGTKPLARVEKNDNLQVHPITAVVPHNLQVQLISAVVPHNLQVQLISAVVPHPLNSSSSFLIYRIYSQMIPIRSLICYNSRPGLGR